tara:strand:+ start:303 stop:698 length:396 start_codon:yes stop_codon:yes gene_type:complete
MSKEYARIDRIADAIRKELAVLVRESVRDPRVGMVNINEVDLSRDFSTCKVYLGFVGSRTEADIEEAMKALSKAAGYLRRLLAARIQLRVTPRIIFFYDDTTGEGMKLEALIDDALTRDRLLSEKRGPETG